MADAKTVLTKSTASASERGVLESYRGGRRKIRNGMIHFVLTMRKAKAQMNKPVQVGEEGSGT